MAIVCFALLKVLRRHLVVVLGAMCLLGQAQATTAENGGPTTIVAATTVTGRVARCANCGMAPGVSPQIFQFSSTGVSAGTLPSIGYVERSVSTYLEI
jgi:hypothetical protein